VSSQYYLKFPSWNKGVCPQEWEKGEGKGGEDGTGRGGEKRERNGNLGKIVKERGIKDREA